MNMFRWIPAANSCLDQAAVTYMDITLYQHARVITIPRPYIPFQSIKYTFKGIVQPFELGGVTRLIGSAVKFCMAGN
jgi:hypothetical protein